MASVWDAMTWSMEQFIANEVKQGEVGVVEDVKESLIKITLLVIGRKGFGKDWRWRMSETESFDMPFEESLFTVEQSVLLQIVLPAWLMRTLPVTRLQKYWRARVAFLKHLERMYFEKRAQLEHDSVGSEGKEDQVPTDLLGALVHSQLSTEQEARLQGGDGTVAGLMKSEIIGNMCHETSGHTLGFAMAYLALYPEWQEEIRKEIEAACGKSAPTYNVMHELPLTLAVCLETLRLRDIVSTVMKKAIVDVEVPYTTWDSAGNVTRRMHLVKKGSLFVIDSAATSLNPHAWGADSMEFNPRRHLMTTPPYVSFSLGARQWLGKRFAEVEMTSFISGICFRYTILPVKTHEGETWHELKTRMIDSATEQISFTPGRFAVRLEKR
ncbi:uncharacterized protein I303_108467 [Kwoniella dejecticola CBS 10117]|uniref:Cytochrome P450 n=1 Tax=Kwoniella dejecticola CBS 10117 TaxID=1296121 RepID=A0A1A5ZXB7_9TREE|nr:uncharacterized protein I303_07211 [Kwoniella dejecticola CBS 10117]OBR82451.1 hypothetical protein I303_07211 [Kwoniella dejecticola CBS 10117]